jgi:hypothetical protein
MHLTEVLRIQRIGGALAQRHAALVRAADASAHGSPAQQALRQFELAWLADPAGTEARAEQAEKARAK